MVQGNHPLVHSLLLAMGLRRPDQLQVLLVEVVERRLYSFEIFVANE